MVKDTILSHGSIFNVLITKGLLESVKLSKKRYSHDFKNKRKLKKAKTEKLQILAKKDKEKEMREKAQQGLQESHSKVRQMTKQLLVIQSRMLMTNQRIASENKHSKKTATIPIQNGHWHEKKTGVK